MFKIGLASIFLLSIFPTLICFTLLTNGTFNPNTEYPLDQVFSDMWVRLLNYDLTASPDVISYEAFKNDGKTYTYQLPFPAIIHGILFAIGYGKSSILSVTISAYLFSCISGLILKKCFSYKQINVNPRPFYEFSSLILFTICNPIIAFLATPAKYWEAIAWGATLFLGAIYLSISLLQNTQSKSLLFCFTFISGLTLFSRSTFSIAAIFLYLTTLGVYFYLSKWNSLISDKKVNRWYIILSIVAFLFCIFLLGSINQTKWGNSVEFAPLTKHVMIIGNEWLSEDTLRLELIKKYGPLRLDRIPENTAYYLLPSLDNFQTSPPFIKYGDVKWFQGYSQSFDTYLERTLPLTLYLPLFAILALIGVIVTISKMKNVTINNDLIFSITPSAIAALVPIGLILLFNAHTVRYVGDFLPALIFFSSLGTVEVTNYRRLNSFNETLNNPIKQNLKNSTVKLTIIFLIIGSLFLSIVSSMLQKIEMVPRMKSWVYNYQFHLFKSGKE